jgi:hypothetical protein
MQSRISLILAALSLSALPAAACSCVGSGVGGCKSPTADMIVLATVVSKELVQNGPLPPGQASTGDFGRLQTRRSATAPPPPAPIVKITLSVSEHFRGNSTDSVVIQTDISDCAYPFEAGHEYLVFANEFQGNLTVNKCTATRPAKMAAATIRELRALRDGTALPDLFGFAGTHPADSSENGWEQVEPVPGLTVTARSERGDFRTQTTVDGSYAFRGLSAGRYQVSVQPPEGRLALWNGTADYVGANAGLGETCPVNFEVFYDGRISGTVARGDGQLVSGFVFAEYEGPEKLNAAPVGSRVTNGRFEIGRLGPGLYRLVFWSDAQGPSRAHPTFYPGTQAASEATPIELGDGAHLDGLRFTIF